MKEQRVVTILALGDDSCAWRDSIAGDFGVFYDCSLTLLVRLRCSAVSRSRRFRTLRLHAKSLYASHSQDTSVTGSTIARSIGRSTGIILLNHDFNKPRRNHREGSGQLFHYWHYRALHVIIWLLHIGLLSSVTNSPPAVGWLDPKKNLGRDLRNARSWCFTAGHFTVFCWHRAFLYFGFIQTVYLNWAYSICIESRLAFTHLRARSKSFHREWRCGLIKFYTAQARPYK